MPQSLFSSATIREFFANHRSIRQYKTHDDQPISLPKEDLDLIIYAAQRASTDATAQLYSIIHITDTDLRKELATSTKNAHILSAGEVFVMCADIARVARFLEIREFETGDWPHIGLHFGIGDAVLAGNQLLIAAELLGYGGCWIGGVIHELPQICQRLALPKGVLPFAMLTIGIPDETPPERPRLPRALVVHTNQYQQAHVNDLEAGIAQMNPIAKRPNETTGDWVKLLRAYFGHGGSMEKRESQLKEALIQQGFLSFDQ